MRLALVLAVLGGVIGCADGGLSIRLLLPEAEELSPTSGEEVAEIALEARTLDGDTQRLSRSLGDQGASLDLGSLVPGDELFVAVELRSAGQQLLGYGQTPSAITIEAGESTEVELNVRRPLAYLSNQPGSLATFDASRDLANTITAGIDLSGTPAATTCSPDAGELLVAVENNGAATIATFSTSTHLPLREVATDLTLGVTDMALSGDGRFVVTAHSLNMTGPTGGITVVNLDTGRSRFVDIGPTRRVVIDDERGEVFALVNASVGCGMVAVPAQIVQLSLGDAESGRTLPYSAPASDIALNPMSGELVIADPCSGQVLTMDASDNIALMFELEGVSAVAISDDRVFASGAGGAPLRIRVASSGLDGVNPTIVELPTLIERSVSIDFEAPDETVEIIANADAAEIVDLAAAPGSDRVAVLSRAIYNIDGDGFIIPAQTITTWEYVLIDASSGSQLQRVRTRCNLEIDPSGALLIDWRCGQAPDQQAPPAEFEPQTLSILYGAR